MSATTRARILKAVDQLLFERSAQFFSVRQVAQLAGVAPSLVIRHFRSKDELVFLAVTARMAGDGANELAGLAQAGAFPRFADLVAHLVALDMTNGTRTRDLMSMSWWWMECEEDIFQAAVKSRQDLALALLAKEMPADCPPEVLADLHEVLGLLYTGCLRHALARRIDAGLAAVGVNSRLARVIAQARTALGASH